MIASVKSKEAAITSDCFAILFIHTNTRTRDDKIEAHPLPFLNNFLFWAKIIFLYTKDHYLQFLCMSNSLIQWSYSRAIISTHTPFSKSKCLYKCNSYASCVSCVYCVCQCPLLTVIMYIVQCTHNTSPIRARLALSFSLTLSLS